MEDNQINALAVLLCSDYGEACKHCSLADPESECACTVYDDCKRIVEAGFHIDTKGKWLYGEDEFNMTYYRCSICGCQTRCTDNYCSSCGAKMVKENN